MGTITTRKTKDGAIRYRAAIRINKEGYPPFSESRTFSTKSLAQSYLKKREYEIELDPSILLGEKPKSMLVGEVIELYLADIGDRFGVSKQATLKRLQKHNIAKKPIEKLTRADFNEFAENRLQGLELGLPPCKPQTLHGDIVELRAILKFAHIVLGLETTTTELQKVVDFLRYNRKLTSSDKRTRLPTSKELIMLTDFLANIEGCIRYDIIMWFAIYSGRRLGELVRMRLSDYDEANSTWLIRDAKNPNGAKGHHIKVELPKKAAALLPLLLDHDLRYAQKLKMPRYDDDILLPLSKKGLGNRFTEACQALGIDDLHFHDLRHECATRLAEKGLSIPQIQRVTGHSSWSSLQIYVNMTPRADVIDYDDII